MEQFIKQNTIDILTNQIQNQTIDLFKEQLLIEIQNQELQLPEENFENIIQLNKIFILYLMLRKKLYVTNQIYFTIQKNLNYFNQIIYLIINLKKNNTFLTFCTELKQKIFTFSTGLAKIKTQKKKQSYYTIKLFINKIKHFILKYQVKKIYIILKGFLNKSKLYYHLLLNLPIILSFNIKFKLKKLHGGCTLRKKKRK